MTRQTREKRCISMSMQFTPSEYKQIVDGAKKEGINKADYIRGKLGFTAEGRKRYEAGGVA